MEIVKVDTFPLLYELREPYGDANGWKKYRTCFLFRITTKDGVEGWGECIDLLPTLKIGFEERIIPYLIGQNVYNRLEIVKTIKKWHQRAATGISMALTEIIAKNANLNICDLWGGAWKNKIPAYASFQSYTPTQEWQKVSLNRVQAALEQGYDKVKVKIGGKSIKEDMDHIEKLQDMLEQKVLVALDANESYDLSTTKQWITKLNKWNNVMWLEEPMSMDQVNDYTILRSMLEVPLAGGENLIKSNQFISLLSEGGIDIIQPDTMHQEGIDQMRHTMHLGRSFGIRVSPHCFDGALSRLYALFAQACLEPWSKMEGEEVEPIEWDMMDNPFSEIIPIKPRRGQITVPSELGIGLEIDIERVEAFQWDGRHYIE